MAPNGSRNGKGKARGKMLTLVIHRRLSFNWNRIKRFISKHICGLIWIYNVFAVKDERAWDLLYDIIVLDPVMTLHFSQFLLIWLLCKSRCLPYRKCWAAFRSYIAQMFDKTSDQMNNWKWDNPSAFRDQVDLSNPQTPSLGQVKHKSEGFSWYGHDHLRVKIEMPRCRQYKPGDVLAVEPLNWDEIIEKDGDDENWADPGVRGSLLAV